MDEALTILILLFSKAFLNKCNLLRIIIKHGFCIPWFDVVLMTIASLGPAGM